MKFGLIPNSNKGYISEYQFIVRYCADKNVQIQFSLILCVSRLFR